MTYLELVQEVVRLADISDSGGPTTTVGQTGDYLQAIKYVTAAHEEIQGMFFDWDFLWGAATFDTSAALATYSGASDLGIWDVARIYYNASKLRRVIWQDYVPEEVSGAPAFFTIQPDNKILIGPTPDGTYTITYDYYKVGKTLTADADVPYIPSRFQRVIVGRALMLYGNFESAAEAKVQGQELYTVYLEQLKAHQLARRQQTHGRAGSEQLVSVVV